MNFDVRKAVFTLAACTVLVAPYAVRAQSTHDEQQQLISQIQTDKHAIVLKTLALDDAQVEAFTPIYAKYQVERRKLFDRAADLLELYGSNYESMTDDVARKILKDWFSLQDDEVALTRKYAKQFSNRLLKNAPHEAGFGIAVVGGEGDARSRRSAGRAVQLRVGREPGSGQPPAAGSAGTAR